MLSSATRRLSAHSNFSFAFLQRTASRDGSVMVNPAITTSMRTIIQRAETGREPRPSADRREEIWSAFSAPGSQASYTVSHSPFGCFHFYKMLLLVHTVEVAAVNSECL